MLSQGIFLLNQHYFCYQGRYLCCSPAQTLAFLLALQLGHNLQEFAKSLGAVWAGDSNSLPPEKLDAAIIFAPAGGLVPLALKAVDKGGTVVCGGIHMSNIPEFEYSLLWEERKICSVANLTREDGIELMKIAPKVPVKTHVQEYRLEQANEALNDLREGKLTGAAVINCERSEAIS